MMYVAGGLTVFQKRKRKLAYTRGTDGLKCRLDNSLPLATRGLVNRVSMTPKRKPSRFHLEPRFPPLNGFKRSLNQPGKTQRVTWAEQA